MAITTTTPFTLKLKSESTIYQTQTRCHVNENEYNLTLNPSAMTCGRSGSLNNNVTGSDFQPYTTTIGLYNETNDLLVVAKMAKPFPMPANTDVTFIIRYDT